MKKNIKKISVYLLSAITLILFVNIFLGDAKFSEEKSLFPTVNYYYKDDNAIISSSDESEFFEGIGSEDSIDIVYKLNYEPYQSDFREQINYESSNSEVDALIYEYRNQAKEYYLERNVRFIEECGIDVDSEDYDVVVSEYSPYVQITYANSSLFIEHKEQTVEKQITNKQLSEINVSIPILFETTATRLGASDTSPQYDMTQILSDIGATSQTYTGKGIKVGIMEAGGVAFRNSHTELNNVKIYTAGSTNSDSHAIDVTRLLCGSNGVARGVDEAYVYYTDTESAFISAMNWFIANGCNIVNASLGVKGSASTYAWASAYMDYQVRYNYITFVAAAGNTGNSSTTTEKGVLSPATGYNAIAVANIDKDHKVRGASSYGAESSLNMRKPNVCAPGTNVVIGGSSIGSGTSYASPITAGVAVKLMEEFPMLKVYPEVVGAVLMASAMPVTGQGNSWDSDVGAGLINYQKAREAMSNYSVFSYSSDATKTVRLSKQFYAAAGKKVKVVAYWLSNSQVSSRSGSSSDAKNIHTDYDLRLNTISDTLLTSSAGYTNIEYICYSISSNQYLNINLYQYSAKKTSQTDIGAIAWCYE